MSDLASLATGHSPQTERSRCARWTPALCAGAVALAHLCAPTAAWAQSSSAETTNVDVARSVAISGREAFNAGDYETALGLFRKAYELYPAPTVALYEARTLENLGLLLEAVDAYARITRAEVSNSAPPQFGEAIDEARSEGAALAARVPKLVVEVRGTSVDDPQLRVVINESPLSSAAFEHPHGLNPGTYHITATVGGERQTSAEVTLAPGQTRRVVLNLSPASADPLALEAMTNVPVGSEPSDLNAPPALAYVAGGVGIVGVGAGVITGLLANNHYDEAKRLCDDGDRCSSPGLDAADAFRTWRMVSSISYGIGAAGIATGVVLWLTSDDSEPGQVATLEPWGTANTAGIRGTF